MKCTLSRANMYMTSDQQVQDKELRNMDLAPRTELLAGESKSSQQTIYNRLPSTREVCTENYVLRKTSDIPTWKSQLARSLLAIHVNTP